LLDLAVSDRRPGGVGSGRVVQIIGDNSTAKSVVLKEILGSAQRQGGYAAELDAEYTPDFARAALFGLDVGAWADDAVQIDGVALPMEKAAQVDARYCYRNPQSIEDTFDSEIGPLALMTEGRLPDGTDKKSGEIKFKEAGFSLPRPLVVGVDTFTALPSLAEESRGLDEGSYNMERAKSMSGGFRKWLKHLGRTDTTVVAVDHIRKKLGVVFGPDWTTSGGLAMQQYASTRIFLAHAGAIKNKNDIEIGIWVRAKCVKNKLAPPFREVRFAVLFDYGVDDIRSNLEWLKEQKVDSKLKLNGAWYAWGEERLGNGLEAAIAGVEQMGIEQDIEDEVVRVWRDVYASPERKPRERMIVQESNT
jgi:recombination protein RecA